MHIGMVTDSLAQLSTDEVLHTAAELGLKSVEFCCGNWSAAPHLNLQQLLSNSKAREDFHAKVRDHGLTISALNASGNPLHPGKSGVEHHACVEGTLELAGKLGVERVVMMSGLPGGPGDQWPNWITVAWPPFCAQILDYQWNDVAIPWWKQTVRTANQHGIEKLCIEFHGGQLVYNLPTFWRLREAVGETVGVNFDPSHLLWMGADPLACIDELGDAIYHVHAKDTSINPRRAALNSRLESQQGAHPRERSWNYVTLGYGQDERWWKQFCYQLRLVGYDDVLSIEHEDAQLSRLEGIRKSVDLLQRTLAAEPSDYQLPDIG
ncbi:sugar phosphate isomerase/epimerase family protein [Candidatus Pantoea multigeneris]|uniref:Sugar phosphate isomerase/epimerase n=1 Tax=Candidatus Pantoea multigeneris TaxID=2608357 RepID=A0ABX0RG12_9GAMM|nr:sugar phosphate isomerase/epimerase [Pantoea multigeneris]NIF22180.1 sugar phosphate isomerase/epimerase [Pantoea multigeneris]